MKITHLQVIEPASGGRVAAISRRIESLRGVVGVVAVRTMGLVTVLYDETRIAPVTISDAAVEMSVQPPEGPDRTMDEGSRDRERATVGVVSRAPRLPSGGRQHRSRAVLDSLQARSTPTWRSGDVRAVRVDRS
jgi:hypothetical protein